ncbi:hypothetical protein GCM10007887_36770 [Methylobacterium haplocladii]|uniref:Uncharacterized protein n=1 Tax=Methylobacterium haplocladii TaxID=1176176 RepID=A0A512IVV6_9HYPH|nr:hypothetical protein MHA02_42120 [Methylobacterium haplocladii]GLS60985.1 hypothetical protein GCM10007887_36770 [Methylobacterium haplocladii]
MSARVEGQAFVPPSLPSCKKINGWHGPFAAIELEIAGVSVRVPSGANGATITAVIQALVHRLRQMVQGRAGRH